MKHRRPPVVTVFAWLNIAIGGLGFLCGSCGGLFKAVDMAVTPPTIQNGGKIPGLVFQEEVQRELPWINGAQFANLLALGAMALGLVICGLGLLMMQDWGRWLAIIVTAAVFLHAIASLTFHLGFLRPAGDRAMEKAEARLKAQAVAPPPGMMAGMSIGLKLTIGMQSALAVGEMVYMIALLIILYAGQTAAAFAPRRKRRRRPEWEDDENDDRDD